uniref:Uncharacterized protein n=1 Tax=Anser brachyrhynchus TaxID=132585 RepID=A0A8B9C8G7_9AVES
GRFSKGIPSQLPVFSPLPAAGMKRGRKQFLVKSQGSSDCHYTWNILVVS